MFQKMRRSIFHPDDGSRESVGRNDQERKPEARNRISFVFHTSSLDGLV